MAASVFVSSIFASGQLQPAHFMPGASLSTKQVVLVGALAAAGIGVGFAAWKAGFSRTNESLKGSDGSPSAWRSAPIRESSASKKSEYEALANAARDAGRYVTIDNATYFFNEDGYSFLKKEGDSFSKISPLIGKEQSLTKTELAIAQWYTDLMQKSLDLGRLEDETNICKRILDAGGKKPNREGCSFTKEELELVKDGFSPIVFGEERGRKLWLKLILLRLQEGRDA